MYLSRYKLYKSSVICEINPATGEILKKFAQPKDWIWDPNSEKANWERYSGIDFLVYKYQGKLVFQAGSERFELDESYHSEITSVGTFRKQFKLFKKASCVFSIIYRDPQTRIWSLIDSLFCNDDPWNWDTPFDDVNNYLES